MEKYGLPNHGHVYVNLHEHTLNMLEDRDWIASVIGFYSAWNPYIANKHFNSKKMLQNQIPKKSYILI